MHSFLFFFSSRRRHTRCALVTGVQTCALPISVLPEYLSLELAATFEPGIRHDFNASLAALQALQPAWLALYADLSRELCMTIQRSEERGVGKECVRTCRFRWSPDR